MWRRRKSREASSSSSVSKSGKRMKDIIILGIESSCDDTSAAVIRNGVLLSNVVAGQAVHESYGGVVPELASRAHQQNVVPVVHEALKRAGVKKEELSAVAFTRGPGLMGSLLVGVSFAKGLPVRWGFPWWMSIICRDMCWHISSKKRGWSIIIRSSRSSVCWCRAETPRLSW